MAKDSQIDPKETRIAKSKGGPTLAGGEKDGEGRNAKKQSIKREKPGSDK